MQQQHPTPPTNSLDLGLEIKGTDGEGKTYNSLEEMWRSEMYSKEEGKGEGWYDKGLNYWQEAKADIDGVLGDYGHTHPIDIADSEKLFEHVLGLGVKTGSALDVGAGIGRISESFLTRKFQHVDILEAAKNLIDKARDLLKGNPHMRTFYHTGIQNFKFETKYDVVWIQWVVGSLKDSDFIDFLKNASDHLTDTGVIVLKDNAASESSGFIVDKTDSSISRTVPYFKKIFEKAGLEVVFDERFKEFPEECIPVWKFILKPKDRPAHKPLVI